jgi:hypothetical protein
MEPLTPWPRHFSTSDDWTPIHRVDKLHESPSGRFFNIAVDGSLLFSAVFRPDPRLGNELQWFLFPYLDLRLKEGTEIEAFYTSEGLCASVAAGHHDEAAWKRAV